MNKKEKKFTLVNTEKQKQKILSHRPPRGLSGKIKKIPVFINDANIYNTIFILQNTRYQGPGRCVREKSILIRIYLTALNV